MEKQRQQLRGARRFGCEYCEAFCLMKYQSQTSTVSEIIWNSRDAVTPFGIMMLDGSNGVHADWNDDTFAPNHIPKIGDRVFVNLNLDHATAYRIAYVEKHWDHPEYPISTMYYDKWSAINALAAEDVKSFGIGTSPHLVTVDEWLLADLKSRRVPATTPLLYGGRYG
jgi:hypothetical protein